MHVALLIPVAEPEATGEAQELARTLGAGLAARGHRVRLITTHRRLRRTRTEVDGVEVVRWPRAFDERLRRRLYDDGLAHCATAFRELLVEPPDVCHALHHTGGAAAARLRGRTGTPAVLTLVDVPERGALAARRLRLALARRAVLGASALTATSAEAAAAAERWLGAPPARVLPPPPDVDAYERLYEEVVNA